MKPDLDAIRARCEAATPGPWSCKQYHSPHDGSLIQYQAYKGETETIADITLTSDAEFVANARTDIPALLAYIDELEERCRAYEQMSYEIARSLDTWKQEEVPDED